MSSCLSGGGRAAYGFDLEIVKSPSTSTTRAASHNTPSPSSTLSESNSPLTISTRKPRTSRKRPNQTYNEAAALLSTAYPYIFSTKEASTKHNSNSQQRLLGLNSHYHTTDFDESSDLLLPFENRVDGSDLLFHSQIQAKSELFYEPKEASFGGKAMTTGEIDDSEANPVVLLDDFDAESILDEEIEEGIDSIMGNSRSNGENSQNNGEFAAREFNCVGNCTGIGRLGQMMMNSWYGNSMGIGFGGSFERGFGLRSALRYNDDANWWRFPTVDFEQISPRIHSTATSNNNNQNNNGEAKSGAVETSKKKTVTGADKKKKKKEKLEKPAAAAAEESKSSELGKEDTTDPNPEPKASLLLKLNYDGVLDAWSDRASPFSDDILASGAAGTDVHVRLAQIDLFGDDGGLREASVLRYKEKRRTRLFSKKIRYEVRKVNADQRPRMKGRFVRRPNAIHTNGKRDRS